ncbi:hypothetical protein BT93_H0146 [Corymbia citriodora subsp. variegata]|nr:hypothetical protein BT93_H0146 [Corymbia citriodora subsp. variegata]
MEASGKELVLLLGLMAAIACCADAQTLCNVPYTGLEACRPAVTPPNPSPPTGACCDAVSQANLQCLCQYKNSPLLPSLGIDPNLVLQLPEKCNLPDSPPC